MKRVDQWEIVAAVAMRCTSREMGAYRIATALSRLASIAKSLDRYYVHMCNLGDLSPTEEIRMRRLEKRAEDIGVELGIVVTTQRDPQRASVKLWADREDGRMLGCF